MKTIILIITILSTFAIVSCKNNNNTQKQEVQEINEMQTTVKFDTTFFDFGDINQDETVLHTFQMTNTGTNALVIKEYKINCACTKAKFESMIVEPGKTIKVEVSFNSSGRNGYQSKEIRIFANVQEEFLKLSLVANVKNNNN